MTDIEFLDSLIAQAKREQQLIPISGEEASRMQSFSTSALCIPTFIHPASLYAIANALKSNVIARMVDRLTS